VSAFKEGKWKETKLGDIPGVRKRLDEVAVHSTLIPTLHSILYPQSQDTEEEEKDEKEMEEEGAKITEKPVHQEEKVTEKHKGDETSEEQRTQEFQHEKIETKNKKGKEKEQASQDFVIPPPRTKQHVEMKEHILEWRGVPMKSRRTAIVRGYLRILRELREYSRDSLLMLTRLLGCGVQFPVCCLRVTFSFLS
jgi:hypothetical protein